MTVSTEHPLRPEHVPGCLALSQAASWNQNEADWRLMLEIGHGWGRSLGDGTLIATTLVLPYGDFAWISMVLVHPAHRRQGHAARLLRIAIDDLQRSRLTPVLDATPAGREVYRQAGFRDTWIFKRLFCPPDKGGGAKRRGVSGGKVFSAPDFVGELAALDREAFGADRTMVLRALQTRLPQCASALDAEGFVLGREGREAQQLGPLVARDPHTARLLLEQALSAASVPLYLDVADHAAELEQWLQSIGLVFQRPFTRMVHGAARAPGNERLVYLVAGPELG